MKILYVYAHPNPSSFNHLMMEHALHFFKTSKTNIKVSDLYTEHFNAIASWHDFAENVTSSQYFLAQQEAFTHQQLTPDITLELDKISWADHLILQFPLWWFSVPAILKGWLDRVLVKGFAYDAGKIFDQGLLKGKTASLVLTTQSPESAYQITGLHRATIDTFLHHIHHTLHFVGIKPLSPFVIYGAFNLDMQREKEIIINYQNYLKNLIAKKNVK